MQKIPDFLKEMLEEQYGKEITEGIIAGYTVERNASFRVNTLKSSVSKIQTELTQLGILCEKVPWSKEAFIIKSEDAGKVKKLDIYQNGEIYFQSLSSMLPPIILNPKPDMDILDMASAPGSKTTQMAMLSNNQSHITACEMNKVRAERLKYNVEKQGATCVYIMLKDSRKLDDFFSFDQILLDAPCSGSGTLSINDNNIEKYFTKQLIEKSKRTQLQLLQKAINILKPGREMVYSTCSILQCENEDIVNKVLEEKKVEMVPIEFEGMESLPLLPTQLKGTLCIAPNELFEGFFVAKLKKH